MISIQSLSENLLPNLYLKSATLNTKFSTVASTPKSNGYGSSQSAEQLNELKADENYSTSNVSLSIKFLRNLNLQSEILRLFDSGLAQNIEVYVHQIEDISTYQSVVQNPDKLVLTTIDPAPGVKTRKTTLAEVSSFTNLFYLNQNVGVQQSNSVRLPEQTLQDGTSLFEVVLDFNFEFDKDALFLGYVFVTAIKNVGAASPDPSEVFISKPSSEIAILNGKIQNTGALFTIAPHPAGSTPGQIKQLDSFGKPGDVWAGGVHYHEPSQRFMAGTEHDPNKTHPFLDYSIVPVRKIVDNRIKDKVEKNIINITKAIETLNSGFTRYKNSANYLDFDQYKTTPYVSDIYLSQDNSGNVNGAFSVDKLQILKKKSAFKFLFEKLQLITNPIISSDATDLLLNLSSLQKLSLYEKVSVGGNYSSGPETHLCTINQESENVEQFSTKVNYKGQPSTQPYDIDVIFMKDNFSIQEQSYTLNFAAGSLTINTGLGIEYFSFKRIQNGNNVGKRQYSVLVEYSDPTIEIVRGISGNISQVLNDLDNIISGNANVYNVELVSNDVIASVESLAEDPGLALYFYNPNYDYDEFKQYLKTLGTFDKNSYANDSIKKRNINENLSLLVQFLNNLKNTIDLSLSNIGSKTLKSLDGTAESNSYGTAVSKVSSKQTPAEPNISHKSKSSEIEIYNYGYDFTGYLKRVDRERPRQSVRDVFGDTVSGRDDNQYLTITTDDYKAISEYLFSLLINNNADTQNALQQPFSALGLGINTPNESAYSYLNTPVQFIRDCVELPSTVLDKNILFNSSKFPVEFSLQLLFYNIIKFKKQIFENHLSGLDSKGIAAGTYIQEEITSILTDFGFRVPSLVDVDYTKELPSVPTDDGKKSSSKKLDIIGIESPISPAFASKEVGLGIDAANYQYKVQIDNAEQSNLPASNFFLGSVLDRKLFEAISSFRLNTFDDSFTPWSEEGSDEYFSYHFPDNSGVIPPLQVLSLSINTKSAINSTNPFRNFLTSNQDYIRNGVINPFLLSIFWFKHQNIVRVEYLQGYENTTSQLVVKNEDGTLFTTENGSTNVEIKTRNLGKPIWKPINKDIIDNMSEGTKYLCRLSRYNYPYYVNKRLVSELNLPLLSNYFILEKPIRSFN